jgi:hypothetical protein
MIIWGMGEGIIKRLFGSLGRRGIVSPMYGVGERPALCPALYQSGRRLGMKMRIAEGEQRAIDSGRKSRLYY